MAKLEIHRVPVLRDNYVWLAHEASSNLTAAVDPAVVDPVLAALDVQGWSLTHILNTHHHHDHTGGNLELKEKTGCTIVVSRSDRERIPGSMSNWKMATPMSSATRRRRSSTSPDIRSVISPIGSRIGQPVLRRYHFCDGLRAGD